MTTIRWVAALVFLAVAIVVTTAIWPAGMFVMLCLRTALLIHGKPIPGVSDFLLWAGGHCRNCHRHAGPE